TAYDDLNPAAVAHLLDLATRNFDSVVIDLPRVWRSFSRGILLGSNKVFIFTEMSVPGLRNARVLVGRLEQICGTLLDIGVIFNKRKRRFFGQYLKSSDVKRVLGARPAGFVSANDELVREAIDRGVPLFQLKKANAIDKDMAQILFTSQ